MALKDYNFQNLCNSLSLDELKFYREKIINQIESCSKEVANHERILYILILSYFLIQDSNLSSIQLGPLSFEDLNFALLLIPPIYAYILISILSTYNFAQVQKENLKVITKKLTSIEIDSNEMLSSEMILTPFSIGNILRFVNPEKSKAFLIVSIIIMIFLVFLIPITVLAFLIYLIYELYLNFSVNWFFKASFIVTIWLFLILVTSFPSFIQSSIEELDQSSEKNLE